MIDMIHMVGIPFLVCLLLAGILSYLGLHVLKREVIFLDIAMAQFAAFGAVVAHIALACPADSRVAWAASLGATLLAALFFAVTRRRVAHLHVEAVIGISYAMAAAATLLVIGTGTGGHTHVQEMLSGSILWATWNDLAWCAAVFAGVGLCFRVFRAPLQGLSEDYVQAARTGHRTLAWDFLFYALCGVVITVGVGIAGVVAVFTFLIIPAVISAFFARGWGPRFLVAWGVGALASMAGLTFGYTLDFSAGNSVGLMLGLILLAATLRPRTIRSSSSA